MILKITGTDGATVKIRNVVCVGELGIKPGNLYYQQINTRKGNKTVHEVFVPFEKIERWLCR